MEFLPDQLEDWLGASSGHLAEKCLSGHLDCSIGNRLIGHFLGTSSSPSHACLYKWAIISDGTARPKTHWCTPPGKSTLNFCLALLVHSQCPPAQMTELPPYMIKMSTAGLPSDQGTYPCPNPACILPSTWLYRRGMRKVFPRVKAARV